jgi:catechol 2,3-dioxygenase
MTTPDRQNPPGGAAPATAAIDPATQVGVVALTVANLDRSLAFYTAALGFAVLRREGADAILGVAGTPLLLLQEQPGALPWMIDNVTGLYHFAILVPSRADLGRWLRHYLTQDYPPPGQGDHVVSEALYLRDPDGHGIEVYADRPREGWRWIDGQVRMGAGPVDVRGLLAAAEASGQPWTGLGAGTRIGHMHLQVGDIAQADAFYHGLLGFDITAQMPTALFVSAGGYHHHLGVNTWHSQSAGPAPADTATLRYFTLDLAGQDARRAVVARLEAAGVAAVPAESGAVVVVRDPWQNVILLHLGTAADAEAARALDAGASGVGEADK